MIIHSNGPKIQAKDIEAIEDIIGGKLPTDYREFLLLYNGGSPTPDTIDIPEAPGTPTDVQVCFGIGRAVQSSDLSWNLSLINERCPGYHMLPIACDSGGNLFCLKYEHGIVSKVIYCDLESLNCKYYTVAPSFTEFVGKLRTFHS